MPHRDYYEVLGVSRKATAKEIRHAYRLLARRLHPDLNPGNPHAPDAFRALQAAYDVLSDPRKRKAYDYYGPGFAERIPARDAAGAQSPTPSRPRASATGAASWTPPSNGRSRAPGAIVEELFAYARRGLGRLAIATALLFGFMAYLLRQPEGQQEFLRAHEAMRRVSSWKTERRIPNLASPASPTFDVLDEVVCPASERITQHFATVSGAQVVLETFEMIIIGTERFSYDDHSKRWSVSQLTAMGPANACANLARGEDTELLPPLKRWATGFYVIEKAGLRESSGGECREWKVTLPASVHYPPVVEYVCIGVKDHLPRFRGNVANPTETRLFDWSVPVHIRPPEMSAAVSEESPIRP
jgi:curved DNA-binding protein CbpA